ncbi:MAG: hypothetical protein K8S23_05955 [Candidatus Cloacimonetes bacterium]|nr:hypothetical protein [Candidatus Cloacimonadota bacterium]
MKLKTRIIYIVFLLIMISLSGRDFKKKNLIKEYHLKDGTIIKGKKITETPDTLVVETKYLGKLKLKKDILKFAGENLNNGTMFGIIPFFNSENENVFRSSPIHLFSSAKIFDEKISSTFNLGYMYKSFEHTSEKFLKTTNNADSTFSGLMTNEFNYKSHFLFPTLVLRFSPLPTKIQDELTDKYHIYPYLGLGGGYSVGMIKYKLNEDFNGIDKDDFDYVTHMYFGPIYEFMIGIAVRLSGRTALVFELMHQRAEFEQKLSSTEKSFNMKSERFVISGFKPMIGIRFGKF